MIHFITQRYNFSSIRPRHSANHIFLRTFRKESEQGRNGNNLHRQHLKLKNLLIHKSRARSISLFLFIYEGWQNVANRRKWKSFVDFRHFTPPVSWAYREAQSWEIWNVNKRSNVNAKCINSRFFFSARDFRESEEKKTQFACRRKLFNQHSKSLTLLARQKAFEYWLTPIRLPVIVI